MGRQQPARSARYCPLPALRPQGWLGCCQPAVTLNLTVDLKMLTKSATSIKVASLSRKSRIEGEWEGWGSRGGGGLAAAGCGNVACSVAPRASKGPADRRRIRLRQKLRLLRARLNMCLCGLASTRGKCGLGDGGAVGGVVPSPVTGWDDVLDSLPPYPSSLRAMGLAEELKPPVLQTMAALRRFSNKMTRKKKDGEDGKGGDDEDTIIGPPPCTPFAPWIRMTSGPSLHIFCPTRGDGSVRRAGVVIEFGPHGGCGMAQRALCCRICTSRPVQCHMFMGVTPIIWGRTRGGGRSRRGAVPHAVCSRS